jgi:hypothetical protein
MICGNVDIRAAAKPLVKHGNSIMPRMPKHLTRLGWQVLVNLEFHGAPQAGTASTRSWESSAAYAMAGCRGNGTN